MQERKDKIKGFLAQYFRSRALDDEEDIFALGFVNSLLAMQMVNFVEKEFGVTIDDEDLDFENFRTISNIDALIERKVSSPAEA